MERYFVKLKKEQKEEPVRKTDYKHLTFGESIQKIKEGLENGNFSCCLWTHGLSNEEIHFAHTILEKEGIVHVYDEIMDAINCFQTTESMVSFYKNMRDEHTEEELQFLRDKNYNTPLIKFFE